MADYAVFGCCEGMFDDTQSQPHGFWSGPLFHACDRFFIQMRSNPAPDPVVPLGPDRTATCALHSACAAGSQELCHRRLPPTHSAPALSAAPSRTSSLPASVTDGPHLNWSTREDWRDWARLSEGCYLLRSTVTDWSGEELWRAYMQLTEAEAAFRIHKSDLVLRPVWQTISSIACRLIF
jgi:hypothetical protein